MAPRYSITVSRRAASQIREAEDWWRRHRPLAPLAPLALADDLERAFDLLAIQPGIGSLAQKPLNLGVRRILLGRIGYHIYYRPVDDRQTVMILAFWHIRRGRFPRLENDGEPE